MNVYGFISISTVESVVAERRKRIDIVCVESVLYACVSEYIYIYIFVYVYTQ